MTIDFEFEEGQEVRLKVDPDKMKMMVVGLHSQSGIQSYTIGNGLYTGIHFGYEIESFNAKPKGARKAGFASREDE